MGYKHHSDYGCTVCFFKVTFSLFVTGLLYLVFIQRISAERANPVTGNKDYRQPVFTSSLWFYHYCIY